MLSGSLSSGHSLPITVVITAPISMSLSDINAVQAGIESNTSYCPIPTCLCPGKEDDTGRQIKSRHLRAVHYRSLAKNET